MKELSKVNNQLLIGIPCEKRVGERRLPLTPEAVDILTDMGHRVLVEKNAGLGINYPDNFFSEAGAEIVRTPEEVYSADVILKIMPPLAAEVAMMKPRTTLFSAAQLSAFEPEAYEMMMAKRINAISYEWMVDAKGHSPVLSLVSEIEGTVALTIAASLLSNIQQGKGVLLGGIPGIAPTEVLIIGAGVAGTVAARAALGMGATVKIFDDDINKLRTIQQVLGLNVFTSNFHPKVLHNAFRTADVVIGAMSHYLVRSKYMIAADLVRTMKKGALIIDLRVSQGGCFETTCGLSPSGPDVFEQYGVLHYCRPNISNIVARTTSMAFSNIFVPLLTLLGDAGSLPAAVKEENCFRTGTYMYLGKPVNSYISNHFNILSNNLDIYLSAF